MCVCVQVVTVSRGFVVTGLSELSEAVVRLFAGPISLRVLSSSLLESCRYRLCLCRNVLVTLLMLRRRGGREVRASVCVRVSVCV